MEGRTDVGALADHGEPLGQQRAALVARRIDQCIVPPEPSRRLRLIGPDFRVVRPIKFAGQHPRLLARRHCPSGLFGVVT